MTADAPRMKPWTAAIHAYTPGASKAADGRALVKLSANENPLGCSAAVLAAAADSRQAPATYPDPQSELLREALGRCHRLDPARIVCGTGSDELLNLAAQAFAGPGDEVLFTRYAFAVYDIAARRCGATPVEAPDRGYGTDVEALLACVTPRTRVVFLANPNNPTGTFLPRAELARLHTALPADVLLVVDQAYAEYLEPEDEDGGLDLSRRAPNVLVTRTFSKIYGLAGERIGWATGAAPLVEALNRIRGPFNVTATGQRLALAALGDQEFVARSRAHNLRWRTWLAEAIGRLGNSGLAAVPSRANFLLVTFPDTAAAAAALGAFAAEGYAVRHLPGQGLGHALRITIGTERDVRACAAILQRLATTL
ncbi:histidinol-phosphate transaminase [Erythrobacteraceae bacterium CFH 75059]|uniref:pyridoxal phosphate-dependent aminotransferase n=1 Tax=Qipengyuania thermophila TaxID=2509361 RepID=UPI0010211F6D|nr:histidinol-phosphate transaminase [Qipengyuania thermophila]TCD06409.1 histidinol-phosphate transaminase [Erythrobacteraceae bacterium CFH 75059]